MGRTRTVKVSDEEYALLCKARDTLRKYGVNPLKLSKEATATLKDYSLGSYIALGSQLIIELCEK